MIVMSLPRAQILLQENTRALATMGILEMERTVNVRIILSTISLNISAELVSISARNTNVCKFANFAGLCFPYFTTFCYQILPINNIFPEISLLIPNQKLVFSAMQLSPIPQGMYSLFPIPAILVFNFA